MSVPPTIKITRELETIQSVSLYADTRSQPQGFSLATRRDLYGTAITGGGTACTGPSGSGCGVVFKLTPPAISGGAWGESTFYSFQGGNDGNEPAQQLLILNNKFYGVTSLGGGSDDPGTAFEIMP